MISVSHDLCTGCSACQTACPTECITMQPDEEGFLYPSVDSATCISCGRCNEVCPALKDGIAAADTRAYACQNGGPERLGSSSGGIFSILAGEVLNQGGVVFGAVFDEQFTVRHSMAEDGAGLAQMRGSKYLQSRIGDAFHQAAQALNLGRRVLFTGTPCQVAGLRAYLGGGHPLLYTADMVCHGVPSPKVWKRYLSLREAEAGGRAASVSFRDKENGWRKFSTKITFQGGKEYCSCYRDDPYMSAFLGGLCLRPSCYHCHFKGISRESDLTLADFWGVNRILGERDDNLGMSLLLVHTVKGEALFSPVRGKCAFCREVDPVKALCYNRSATESPGEPAQRAAFFSRYEREDFSILTDELLGPKGG